MDQSSKMYDDQIKKLLNAIDKYASEIDSISAVVREKRDLYNTGSFVDYKEFTTRQRRMRTLNKKIKECVSTIGNLSDKIEYDENDFVDDINMVKYRAEITQNTLSKSAPVGEGLSCQVMIRNVGFETWDSTNAYLTVDIVRDDSLYGRNIQFNLAPEEQVLLGNEKTFSVFIPAFTDDGIYNITIYMANATYSFNRKYEYSLYVTN